jgi:hypothetical protein
MNGIELIAKERKEQQEKHDISVKNDAHFNSITLFNGITPMPIVVIGLLDGSFKHVPSHWDKKLLDKMRNKPYKERLIIAGALLAAEIDRVQYVEEQKTPLGDLETGILHG